MCSVSRRSQAATNSRIMASLFAAMSSFATDRLPSRRFWPDHASRPESSSRWALATIPASREWGSQTMSTAKNGDVEIYYETFGDPAQPTLVLINGLGSQCINYRAEWCELFVAEGYHVVRLDNRDVGLSS